MLGKNLEPTFQAAWPPTTIPQDTTKTKISSATVKLRRT